MKHFSIHIYGRVQGVFFRASTKEKADDLHISGLVRNNIDGSVSIEAEGEEEALEKFVMWCKNGPKLSRVDRCEIKENAVQQLNGFSIQR